ncbi:MAG: hypothetical protein HS115_05655 [Spirochaetales bacterium]|nr:hypothetical protein [Spirochaetales bacterium]
MKDGLLCAFFAFLALVCGLILGEWQAGIAAAVLSFLPCLGYALWQKRRPRLAIGIYLGGTVLRLFAVFPLAFLVTERALLAYCGCVGLFLFFEVVSKGLLRISGRTRT